MYIRKAAKKVFLVVRPLRKKDFFFKALVDGPLKKRTFFAASLRLAQKTASYLRNGW